MLVIVPTRNRPNNMVELINSWKETVQFAHLLFAVDDDDVDLEEYKRQFETNAVGGMFLHVGPRLRLGGTLNALSVQYTDDYGVIGFMGDDHRPRTPAWDTMVMDAFEGQGDTGFVYGNDLIWGEDLPTSVFIASDIIKTLGFMVPPGMIHLYFDDFWRDFGRELGKITYLPNMIIEHMHPSVGKSVQDAGYTEVNAPEMYDHDRAVYETYKKEQMSKDVKRCV